MKKWNKLTIFLIPIGIAVNVVGGQLALMLKLPVFLDSIGTFVVAALTGIGPGLIIAIGTQLISKLVCCFLYGHSCLQKEEFINPSGNQLCAA